VNQKTAYPAHPEVPISMAVRAGDFVFTSAYGPWTFDPADMVFDEQGNVIDDGSGLKDMPFDQQVHATFGFIRRALEVAGCGLEDVVDCQCWFTDARDFQQFNPIYKSYFPHDPPVRSVFPMRFMFACRLEMKVIAFRPLARD
jgi:enamine deaminase RidA (YjgF/YER057c/UK114 family)